MPKYEMILRSRVEKTLSVQISAKDEETAEDEMQNVLYSLGSEGEISKKYEVYWEIDLEEIQIEEIREAS